MDTKDIFQSDFLNIDNTKDGQIATILDEGIHEHNEKLGKKMFNLKVKIDNKEYTFSPYQSHGKVLQEAYGYDSKEWIGKKFEILHIDKKLKIRAFRPQQVA